MRREEEEDSLGRLLGLLVEEGSGMEVSLSESFSEEGDEVGTGSRSSSESEGGSMVMAMESASLNCVVYGGPCGEALRKELKKPGLTVEE